MILILINKLDLQFLLYILIPILYMLRATMCSSSGESIVSIQHLVYVSRCRYWCRCDHVWANECLKYVEMKCQLDATEVFIAVLIACSTCFGHHYAHHQELKSIIQWLLPVVDIWCCGFQVAGLVWSWGLCVRFAGCCSILQTGH